MKTKVIDITIYRHTVESTKVQVPEEFDIEQNSNDLFDMLGSTCLDNPYDEVTTRLDIEATLIQLNPGEKVESYL